MHGNLAQLIRAGRGPVLLMTLGALLAVHQATGLSFDRTFPVLIIVFGMMWLLERMVPRGVDPSMRMSSPATLPAMPPMPPMPPGQYRDPLFGDNLPHLHQEVYGAPARPSNSAPPTSPSERPTAELPIPTQEQKPFRPETRFEKRVEDTLL